MTLGTQGDAVRCVEYSEQHGVAISGGWDKTVRIYDPRSGEISKSGQPEKVHAMTLSPNGSFLTVCHAGKTVYVYDLHKMEKPLQKRTSPLAEATRSVTSFPDNKGFTISSLEGRIAVEHFDQSSKSKSRSYAFKCHRTHDKEGNEMSHPVHSMSFNPRDGSFVSGGAEGQVSVWDLQKKKKVRELRRFPQSVASLSFSGDGSKLAVATSYLFEHGPFVSNIDQAIFIKKY